MTRQTRDYILPLLFGLSNYLRHNLVSTDPLSRLGNPRDKPTYEHGANPILRKNRYHPRAPRRLYRRLEGARRPQIAIYLGLRLQRLWDWIVQFVQTSAAQRRCAHNILPRSSPEFRRAVPGASLRRQQRYCRTYIPVRRKVLARLRVLRIPKEMPKGGLLIALKRSFDKLNGLACQTFRALKIINRSHHRLTRHHLRDFQKHPSMLARCNISKRACFDARIFAVREH